MKISRELQTRRLPFSPVIRQYIRRPRYLVNVGPFSLHEIVLPRSGIHISIRKRHLTMPGFFPVHVVTLEGRVYLDKLMDEEKYWTWS